MNENGTAPLVMVIDDDNAVARMIKVLLVSEGLEVTVAKDGHEALEHLQARTPDVVLLDLQMPVMDGREFYREFRRRGYQAPVIILSAYNAEAACQELGAQAAVNKPFDPEFAIRTIHQAIAVASREG